MLSGAALALSAKAARVLGLFAGLNGVLVDVLYYLKSGESLRVDHADHAGLTVLALRAVEPDGLCVVDLHGEGRHRGRVLGRRHEAREEARAG